MYYGRGWTNSWLPLIVPGFFGGGALNIFLMRQYMRGIPDTICEAAKIDGASEFKILTGIYVPLSKALYATFSKDPGEGFVFC